MINVYCASAGSGKTHLLTGYYLTLLLRNDWTPKELGRSTEYYEVLAVTFTNKATTEMKERIIAELHKLANTPEESPYLKKILTHDDGLQPDQAWVSQHSEEIARLKERAHTLLEKMLCDYSNFNVSTIDSFFQKVIRAFMRELDLPSGYEVQLDEGIVLDAAVNRFLNDLDKNLDPKTGKPGDEYNWVRDFSKESITEGKEWDVRKNIRDLAKELTKEKYQEYRKDIRALTLDKQRLDAYRAQLNKVKKNFEDDLKKLGEECCGWAKDHISDGILGFIRKSNGPMTIFLKWAKGATDKYTDTFNSIIKDPANAFGKNGYPATLAATQISEFENFINRAKAQFEQPYFVYNSAKSILSQLYQLGTLANVDEAVRQYCSDQSMVLIGNTNALLSHLVEKEESPFVYAKVGTHYRSFMIDEFQDTSGMQWGNFLPLLVESNSVGQRNLVVGDVKQSIYRFRGSDWSLLQTGILKDFPGSLSNPTTLPAEAESRLIMDTKTLLTNWRSLRSLVWFNNQLFPMIAKQMEWNLSHRRNKEKNKPVEYTPDPYAAKKAKTITEIYKDVQQNYKPHDVSEQNLAQGLVEVRFLTPEKNEEGEEHFNECAARHVPETVAKLLEGGFALKDIAVLGRKNKQCQLVAEALLKAGYPIISNKALRLDSNDAVIAIISLMRHLQHPHDKLLRAIAGFQLNALYDREADMGEVINCYFEETAEIQEEEAKKTLENIYLRPGLSEIANKPLYELLEGLIALLPKVVIDEESAYLQSLRDQTIQFVIQRTPDLSAFLEWWDEEGHKTNIATPEGEDAISIMTIHQAKGLGLPAIIYPFAKGSLDIEVKDKDDKNKSSILWCQPKDPSLKVPEAMSDDGSVSMKTPAFPIKCNKALRDSDFAEEYLQERLCSIVDELNTVYVALTRAKEALIIYTQATTLNDNQLYSQEKLLEKFRQEISDLLPDANLDAEVEDDRITLGSWIRKAKKKLEPEPKTIEATEASLSQTTQPAATVENSEVSPLPRLSMRQSRMMSNASAVKRGNEMHERLENIITLSDLSNEDQDLRELILRDEVTRSWFTEGLTVYNEQPIVLASGIEKRPDRIIVDAAGNCTVIDYKTSQLEPGMVCNPKHEKQVRIYMSLLQTMFRNVKGYVWYLSMGTYHEVSMQSKPVQLTLNWED